MSILVSTVGMPQSGSTWIHNIVLNIFNINEIFPNVSLFTQNKTIDFFNKSKIEAQKGLILNPKVNNHFSLKNWRLLKHYFEILDKKEYRQQLLYNGTLSEKELITQSKTQINKFIEIFYISEEQLRVYTYKPFVIKEHHYSEELSDLSNLAIVVKRDIRDSIASRRKRNKGLYSKGMRRIGLHNYDENSYKGFEKYCEYLTENCLNLWTNSKLKYPEYQKVIVIEYEDAITNKENTVIEIYSKIEEMMGIFFGYQVKEIFQKNYDEKIKKIVYLSDYKNIKSDNLNTFFTKDKITNEGKQKGYLTMLNDKEIQFINKNYKKYTR
jgi:hypothetical protein